jgi:hypothetical protein
MSIIAKIQQATHSNHDLCQDVISESEEVIDKAKKFEQKLEKIETKISMKLKTLTHHMTKH